MNVIPVGTGQANSADLTMGSAGVATVFMVGSPSGDALGGAILDIQIKGANNAYMRLGSVNNSQIAQNLTLAEGTVFRVVRQSSGYAVGADVTGAA